MIGTPLPAQSWADLVWTGHILSPLQKSYRVHRPDPCIKSRQNNPFRIPTPTPNARREHFRFKIFFFSFFSFLHLNSFLCSFPVITKKKRRGGHTLAYAPISPLAPGPPVTGIQMTSFPKKKKERGNELMNDIYYGISPTTTTFLFSALKERHCLRGIPGSFLGKVEEVL